MFLRTFIGNQVLPSERVNISLFQSKCSVYTKILTIFRLVKIDIIEKMSPRNFIVVMSHRSYFVISGIIDPN